MTTDKKQQEKKFRQPDVFDIDDPNVKIQEMPKDIDQEQRDLDETIQSELKSQNYYSWFSVLIASLAGLIFISITLWLTNFITELVSRQDWIGWISLGLLCLAFFAIFMMIVKEAFGLMRLKKVSQLREDFHQALNTNNKKQAQKSIKHLKHLFQNRKDMRWGLANLKEHEKDILDAEELIILAEREVMSPLDKQACEMIAKTSKRVSVITALSPSAVIDIIAVAYANLKLLRRIATLYGGRPGGLGVLRLARMVITHLTVTGGVALSSDVLQQFMSQRLSAKLSAKLGEGIFNGAMSARIGMAAIDVCRPIPFIKAKRPHFREFLQVLLQGKEKPNKETL